PLRLFAAVAACAGCTSPPAACMGGPACDAGSCAPTTCTVQGKSCGTISDECGGTLDCGSCSSPLTCGGGGLANVCGTPTFACDFYAAPTVAANGSGSATSPWDLQTALDGASGKVQPGNTICLRGGTYAGTYRSSLQGSSPNGAWD